MMRRLPMWCECVCGHHRSDHPWLGCGAYGSASGYGGCGHCQLCDKPAREHVFMLHQFTRCECSEYTEGCDSVYAKLNRACVLVKGHEGRHRCCEVSWTDDMAREVSA